MSVLDPGANREPTGNPLRNTPQEIFAQKIHFWHQGNTCQGALQCSHLGCKAKTPGKIRETVEDSLRLRKQHGMSIGNPTCIHDMHSQHALLQA